MLKALLFRQVTEDTIQLPLFRVSVWVLLYTVYYILEFDYTHEWTNLESRKIILFSLTRIPDLKLSFLIYCLISTYCT